MAGTGDKDNRLKIGVLAGGPSSERRISLKSGSAVCGALNKEGLDAFFIDIRGDAKRMLGGVDMDAAFIALHGGFGEDGTIQRILERRGIPYTGSGPEASRLALDKLASRRIFKKVGLCVPRYKALSIKERFKGITLNMPCVVKPQKEGSSIGLSVVMDAGDMDAALRKAFCFGDKAIIEEFIEGRELTVGILDERPLPVVEIRPEGKCYDYYAKYKSPATRYLIPAPVGKIFFKEAQNAGLKAHRALGCRTFSRVDMILGRDGRVYVLEVNTIPGLTSRSLLPKAAEAAGIDFSSLCKRILKGAFRR